MSTETISEPSSLPVEPLWNARTRRFLANALVALAAAVFLTTGLAKVIGPPGFSSLLGVLEIGGAVGLIFRRTRVLAAAGLASILFGTIAAGVVSAQPTYALLLPAGTLLVLGLGLAVDPGLQVGLTRATPVHKARRVAVIVLALLVAGNFVMAGGLKVLGNPGLISGLGAANYGPTFLFILGSLELLGAIGLFVGVLRAPAAFGLAAILHGAVVTHAMMGDTPARTGTPVVLIGLLYLIIALDGRFTMLVDGVPAWRRLLRGRTGA
jgi:putative oxidoreductase